MFTKYRLLKFIPYIIALIIAIIFYLLSFKTDDHLSNLLINLSASFVAIPLILIFIDQIRGNIDKKLKKELFEYAKKNIDNDILSSIAYINRLFNFPIVPTDSPFLKSIASILNFNEGMVKEVVNSIKPLGFQLYKDWGETEKYFSDALKNPLAIQIFDTEQITTLIQLLKEIQNFETDLNDNNNFKFINDLSEKYEIVKGTDINFRNVTFPNRWILLEKTSKKDEHIVRDFGDFDEYHKDKLLNQYELTENGKNEISTNIIRIIELVNKWLSLTGNEFIFDSKRFRTIKTKKSF